MINDLLALLPSEVADCCGAVSCWFQRFRELGRTRRNTKHWVACCSAKAGTLHWSVTSRENAQKYKREHKHKHTAQTTQCTQTQAHTTLHYIIHTQTQSFQKNVT